MNALTITGGRIIDPANGVDAQQDLHLLNGRVLARGPAPEGFVPEQRLDVQGQWILPGLIDLCARPLGDFGQELRAAAAGGVTSLCVPPEISPCIDTPAVAERLLEQARREGRARLHPIGALTRALAGEQLAELAALQEAGCVAVSPGPDTITDSRTLRQALAYASSHDLLVMLSPRDPWLHRHGCAHEGATSTRLGLPAIPGVAESIGLARDLALVELTGVRAHFCRLSSMLALPLLQQARSRGLPVTADVAAHHLHLCDTDLATFDTLCRVDPPLRDAADRDALRTAIGERTVDAVCSDHHPLGRDAKRVPFPDATPGIAGLETLLPLVLEAVWQETVSLEQAIASLSANPARILGLPLGTLADGALADVCIMDPEYRWTPDAEMLVSQGRNSPFLGHMLRGRVTHTLLGGRIVYRLDANTRHWS
ncbi:MAG: dihydroorotase [Pseudomonadota bacterium]|nr:dihydroorotase [Pseudomonadota bacterium]